MRPNDMPRPFAPDHGEEAPKSERLRLCDAWRVAGEKGLLSELVVGARMVVCLEEDEAEIALLKRTSAEIERECREGWKQARHWRVLAETAETEITRLTAELAQCKADAGRWQWVLSMEGRQTSSIHIQNMWAACKDRYPSPDEWNAAIDAARSAESALAGKG